MHLILYASNGEAKDSICIIAIGIMHIVECTIRSRK